MIRRVVADVHLANHRIDGGPLVSGLNRRAREILDVLQRVGEDGDVIVAGDVFDTDCPTPQLVTALGRTLMTGDADSTLMIGNHDATSGADDDHALGPLKFVESVSVEDRDFVSSDGYLMVPWRPGSAIERLNSAADEHLPSLGHYVRTVLTHCGVYDDDSPPYLRAIEGAVHVEQAAKFARSVGASLFVAGDFHEHKVWDCGDVTVCVVGTLCPAGWDDPGMDRGHVVTIDAFAGQIVEVAQVPGPRFLRASVGSTGAWVWENVDVGDDHELFTDHGSRIPYVLRLRVADHGAGVTADEVRAEFNRRFPELAGMLRYVEVAGADRSAEPDREGPPTSASMIEVIDAWMATPAGAPPDGVDAGRVRTRVVDLLNRESVKT